MINIKKISLAFSMHPAVDYFLEGYNFSYGYDMFIVESWLGREIFGTKNFNKKIIYLIGRKYAKN